MPYPFRVEKRTPSKRPIAKRRKGRRAAWSNSWQTRLVLLRLCGLRLEVVIELLNVLNQGNFDARPRRAQQILTDVLSDSYRQYCPRNVSQMRKIVAFLRSLRWQTRRRNSGTPGQSTSPKRMDHGKEATELSPLLQSPSISARDAFTPPTLQYMLSMGVTDTHADDADVATDPGNDRSGKDEPPIASASSTSVFGHTADTRPTSSHRHSSDDLSIMSRSSVRSRMRQILRKNSYSSSLASDFMSILRRRYSTSSLETMSDDSVHSHPVATKKGVAIDFAAQAREVMDSHFHKVTRMNSALITRCCSYRSTCLHRRICELTLEKSHAKQDELARLRSQALSRETLSFIASSGACADAVYAVVGSSTVSIHEIDSDGQNFMFFLRPAGFEGTSCTCAYSTRDRQHGCICGFGPSHLSSLDCLLELLEQENFNFEHLDHEGRSFLSFLCACPEFNINWLLASIARSEAWTHRVQALSRIRDAAGCFLIDYISLHPNFDQLDDAILNYFRPPFKGAPSGFPTSRLLVDEGPDGANPLHHLSQWMVPFAWNAQANVLYQKSDLNAYNSFGLTPLLHYLDRAARDMIEESQIISNVETLLIWGANLHARSRSGATILHFAAKAAFPALVTFAISLGARVDAVDKQGFSALDYAARVYRISIGGRAAPKTIGSLTMTAAAILNAGYQPPKPRQLYEKNQGLDKDLRNTAFWPLSLYDLTAEDGGPLFFRICTSGAAARSQKSAATLFAHGAGPTTRTISDLHLHATVKGLQGAREDETTNTTVKRPGVKSQGLPSIYPRLKQLAKFGSKARSGETVNTSTT